jgi:TPR repeat protein
VEPITGPSLLGLGGPTLDSLREKAFSGTDPFFEPEEPKTGGRKLLLLVLLVALGGAVWWTYTNYVAIGESQKRQVGASNEGASKVPAEKPAAPQAPETKSADTGKLNDLVPAETPPAVKARVKPESQPEAAATVAAAKPIAHEKTVTAAAVAKRGAHVAAAAPKAAITVSAADNGEAAFKKGEAYLYGHGVPENCDEAIKNLKAASAKSHARARSTFGTMYATGHCVPRDLPTSYVWFALALRVDPNNQILEKDLSAVWNQMTPPERQLATKMKQ